MIFYKKKKTQIRSWKTANFLGLQMKGIYVQLFNVHSCTKFMNCFYKLFMNFLFYTNINLEKI